MRAVLDAAIKRYAALAVPRYTSFPTAADFTAVGEEVTRRWLRQIGEEDTLSLYIHVPYCKQICHYCGCHAKMALRDDVVESFVFALLHEIEIVISNLAVRPQIKHLHWGGGTPSILSPEQFTRILSALRRGFDFHLEAEHAIELDPRTVTPALAKILAAMKVNRASLGVQDIDPTVQTAIGRIQPIETVINATKYLRDVGINRLNFDLIYGLPFQTALTLKNTCEQVAALAPDRIACFGYAHLPHRRANQRLINAADLPNAEERFVQAGIVAENFERFGYRPIGIDHFALPHDDLAIAAEDGVLNRNFQGYTTDNCQTLIGLGPSSISQFPGGYTQNISDVKRYSQCLSKGTLATTRGYVMRETDRIRAAIIASLMCNFRVDLNEIAPDTEFADEAALLRPLISDGLVEMRDGVITATTAGKPLIRLVAAVFDEFRKENAKGFSMAI